MDTDVLRAIADGRVNLKFEDVIISAISIFELQAKAAKLAISVEFVIEAVESILRAFRVEPFHRPETIKTSFEIKKLISDYIDCVLVATAVVLNEDIVTEDTQILSNKRQIEEEYGIKVLNYKGLLNKGS